MKEKEPIKGPPLSRRRFLKSAVAGGAAIAATAPLTGSGESRLSSTGKPKDPLEEVLQCHGSEFGDIRRVQ